MIVIRRFSARHDDRKDFVMGSTELLMVCASAFIAVFLLLALMALVMRIIIILFPQSAIGADAATIAAVASVISAAYPGTRITKVEELQ